MSQDVVIINPMGLHARPAMQFVDLANQFTSEILVKRLDETQLQVDGKSVMQMITLEAVQGTKLRIEATGEDAEQAVRQLTQLVNDRFGEHD